MDVTTTEQNTEQFTELLKTLLESNVITDTESNVPRWTAALGFMVDTVAEDISFFWIMSSTYDDENPFPIVRFISASGERGFGILDWPSAMNMPSMEVYSLEGTASAIAGHPRASVIKEYVRSALADPASVNARLMG